MSGAREKIPNRGKWSAISTLTIINGFSSFVSLWLFSGPGLVVFGKADSRLGYLFEMLAASRRHRWTTRRRRRKVST